MKPAFILSLLLWLLPGYRHDFHTSLAEVQHNPAEQTLEVSLRVFTDDLEAALSKSNGGKTIKADPGKGADPFIQIYLQQHFSLLDAAGRPKPVRLLGKEIAVDVTWLYFEISGVEGLKGKRLQNAVFTELFSDQVNMVNVKQASGSRSYLFNADDPVQELGR